MGMDILTKFLKLMSTNISDDDLELIKLGTSLGMDLASFAELRSSQDDEFVNEIRVKALVKMKKDQENFLINSDSFFAGSIDFMVSNEREGKKFFLLEANGGSHRGLSILTKTQQSLLYNGYLEVIFQVIDNNQREDNKVFIIVGVPVNDGLIHEKVIMIEFFRKTLKSMNYTVKIFNTDNYDTKFQAQIVFLIADYKQLSNTLSFVENWILFKGEKVSILIGDGISRRLNDKTFLKQVKNDFHQINTKTVNPIFRVTDDKSLTYLASYYSKTILKKYNLKYLLFTKAFDKRDLGYKLKYLIKNYRKTFIIKPSGGSGGTGVISISKDEDPANISKLIEESNKEFFDRFMENRNPYPYTIQEKANFNTIKWKEGHRTFDIRLYLAQRNGIVIPIGGLARIARGEYHGTLDKQEFVVNLSGFNGQIEVERGLGFSKRNSDILNLSLDDFVNMSCIGCTLFAYICNNYHKIMNFSNWNMIL